MVSLLPATVAGPESTTKLTGNPDEAVADGVNWVAIIGPIGERLEVDCLVRLVHGLSQSSTGYC